MHVARPSFADARGFTMVELLVVILIIGILAMIALPAFVGQRLKGEDSEAQQMVRTVATALATYHTDESTYDATRADLVKLEPAVNEASADLEIVGTADGFEITEKSQSDTEFTLVRDDDGDVTRSCTVPDRGLCKSDSTW
jgi:type IV pilus assembly protein PilA